MTVVSTKSVLTGHTPFKALTFGVKRAVGRNNAGRITVRHKGGGHKKLLRDVDFKYGRELKRLTCI
jgi:large subunit ribosomal protein L2